jgi:hypothetical protein
VASSALFARKNMKKINDSPAKNNVKLRKLEFSPDVNPLVNNHEIKVRQRHVRTGLRRDLTDSSTGEITAVATIHTIEEKDDAEFVKVFASGIKAIYDLTKTASRVFQTVLEAYQAEPMSRGFVDSVYLAWFDGGLSGRDVGMSDDTFQRGMKELLSKGFLSPRGPNVFWVNPSLFFKGDRVLFLKEYRRKVSSEDQRARDQLGQRGEQQLTE